MKIQKMAKELQITYFKSWSKLRRYISELEVIVHMYLYIRPVVVQQLVGTRVEYLLICVEHVNTFNISKKRFVQYKIPLSFDDLMTRI